MHRIAFFLQRDSVANHEEYWRNIQMNLWVNIQIIDESAEKCTASEIFFNVPTRRLTGLTITARHTSLMFRLIINHFLK